MDPTEAFAAISKEMVEFRQIVDQVMASNTDPGSAEQLTMLTTNLDKNFGAFKQSFPQLMAEVDGEISQAQAMIKQAEQEIAEIEAKLPPDGQNFPEPNPEELDPMPAPVIPEPELGAQLR